MTSFLKELVRMESPTADPATQDAILRKLGEKLESLGFSVLKIPGRQSGGYLVGRPRQREKGRPLQLLIGHCDTVWPVSTLETMPLQQANGQLRGPGVYDMKAGLTQIIFSLKAVRDLGLSLPYTPVVLINSDE